MNTSANFHASNQILFRAPILRKTEASEDFSAGWGEAHSTGEVDVIDLNGNGSADYKATENYGSGDSNTVSLTEPAIVSPQLDKLEAFAKKNEAEVLTQDDLPQGIYVAETSASGPEKNVIRSQESLRPANTLVNDLPQEFDPQAKYAIDFAKGEFLVYKQDS